MRNTIRGTLASAVTFLILAWQSPMAQAQAVADFNLPAQPLADSLRAVGSQTGTNILFDPPLVAGREAPALKAKLSVDQALSNLLAGTNIAYQFINEKTVVLSLRSTKQGGASAAMSGQETAERSELEEIIVTATKREEPLSRVPISISAYDRQALQASGVKNIQDLAALTPGVEFDNSSGFGPGTLTNIAIRGINSQVGTSTVGIYIDDTPVQSRINGLSYFGNPLPLMFDVERVEVERGPQGTLFGAGAEGGALRFLGSEPSLSRYSGFARAELADTEHGAPSYEAGAAVGGPIVDNELGFRASAWYRRDGGYVDHIDPLDGSTVQANSNWADSYALRGALTAAPSDQLKITLSAYGQSVHQNDSSVYFDYLSDPAAGEFKNGRLLAQPNTDRLFLPSLKIEAGFGSVALTSITSFVNRSGHLLDDNTSFTAATFGGAVNYGSPLGPEFPTSYDQAVPTTLVTTLNQISEELRFASTDPNARLKWTAGLYFSNTRQFDGESVSTPYINRSFFGVPADTPFLTTSLTSIDKQYAAFGQVDYLLTDKLTATLGVRVARTDARFTEEQAGLIASSEFPYAQGDQKETPITPKVGFSYQIDDADMVYVSAGKGYRVGGGNLPIPLLSPSDPVGCPLTAEPGSYKSDSVWSYEIGAKDRLFDGRLRLDTSVFHTEWSDIQQSVFYPSCGFGYTANLGRATSNGFDFGLEAVPLVPLTLGLGVAYTDARFTRNVFIGSSKVARNGQAIGNPPNVTSPWNLTGSAKYTFHLPGGQRAYLRAEDIFHSRNNGPFSSQDPTSTSYAPEIPANPVTNMLNFRTGVEWGDTEVSLFVNNVTDAHPALNLYQDTPSSTLFTNSTFRPRTVGVIASYRF